jgi:hypothetical protein
MCICRQVKTEPSCGFTETPYESLMASVKRYCDEYMDEHRGESVRHYAALKECTVFKRSTLVHLLFSFSREVDLFGPLGFRRALQDLVSGAGGACLLTVAPLDFTKENLLALGILALHDHRPSVARDRTWEWMVKGASGSAASSPVAVPGPMSVAPSPVAVPGPLSSGAQGVPPADPRVRGYKAPSLPRPAAERQRSDPPTRSRSRSPSRGRSWEQQPVARAKIAAPKAEGLLLVQSQEIWCTLPPGTDAADCLLNGMVCDVPEWIFYVKDAKDTIQWPHRHDERVSWTVLENSMTQLLLVLAGAMQPCAEALYYASVSVVRMVEERVDLTATLSADLRRAQECAVGVEPVIKAFASIDLYKEEFLSDWILPLTGGGTKPERSKEIVEALEALGGTNNTVWAVYSHLYEAHLQMYAMMPENGVHVRWDRIADTVTLLKQALQQALVEAGKLEEMAKLGASGKPSYARGVRDC